MHKLTVAQRIRLLQEQGFIDSSSAAALLSGRPLLPVVTANRMSENVIGVFGLPFGVAANFVVNGRRHVVPMVVEEPSIIAAVSGAAKLFSQCGGFTVTSMDPVLIGQIQLSHVADPDKAIRALTAKKAELIDCANVLQPGMQARGGGTVDIQFLKRTLPDEQTIVVLHLLVDTRDAMGANVVNSLCEALAPRVAEIAGASAGLCILSNLADRSVVTARGTVSLATLGRSGRSPDEVRDAIVAANDFACVDPYRAATHNKGIMNGIDAVAIATGNDWRAIEASAHAFAARDGAYRALTRWSVLENGDLAGELTIPLKVGVVGGSIASNPGAKMGVAICGVSSATDLAELMAATGLAQNFAALKALVTDGIQKGHMALHARSVAVAAGVPDALFAPVVERLIASGTVKIWKAHELVQELTRNSGASRVTNAKKSATGIAAGKVILLGEHAVVYERHALALPLPNAVSVHLQEADECNILSAPDWALFQEWRLADHDLAGAVAVIAMIMREFEVTGRSFSIEVESRIPIGKGLGSSAAFAVAAIRAFDAFLDLNLDGEAVNDLAFRCETITHGTPSGVDNHIATFAKPLLFRKGEQGSTETIKLQEVPPLVIASSDTKGSTIDLVAGVRRRREKNLQLFEMMFDEIDLISQSGAVALKNCDYDRLGAMMNVCHGLLNAIGVSTPELESMVDIARQAGATGAKLTGAGGGGSVVALCPGKMAEVSQALGNAGYMVVEMDSGQDNRE